LVITVLDTLVITVVGHVGHYCCWTRWSLLLLDTLFIAVLDTLIITVVGHFGHYCVGHVGHYSCWTRWSLLLLDRLVITVVGHVGHYSCWTRWSLLFWTRWSLLFWTRWSLLLLGTCFGVLMLERLVRTVGKLLELELHIRVWPCSPRILLKLLEKGTFTLFRNVGNYQSAFHNISEEQRLRYNAAEVSNLVSVCS